LITQTTRYRRAARLFGAADWTNVVFSNVVIMTITSAIGILSQPKSDTVYQQIGTAVFYAKPNITTAGSATYQWQISTNGGANWGNIANGGYYLGANDTALYVTNPIYTMSGHQYRCVITSTSSCGAVNSNTATLSVLPYKIGANLTTLTCDSWTASTIEVLIPVAGVGALNSSTNVLRQINLSIGNQGACRKDLSTYSFWLIAPNGTTYKFINGLTTSTSSVWGDIKFRDHPALEKINEYNTNVQASYFPYSIGYYAVEADNIFIPTFNGVNADGNWRLRIGKNNGTAGGISLEKAELIFGPQLVAIDVTGNSLNNSCSLATCMGADASIIIGTNNGYSDPDPNYPGGNFSSCNWNQANNNSAWYYFFASSSTANITVSGLKSISGSGSDDMQLVVMDGSNGCSGPWAVPSGGCSNDETTNNSIYLSTVLGGKGGIATSGNIYVNGITANAEFNLTGLIPGRRYLLMIDGTGGNSSSFYIESTTGSQNCILGGLLPVRFSSLNAVLNKDKQTDLSWQTSNEFNNQYFQVERLGGGINWEVVYTVEGAGERSNVIRNYKIVDKQPFKGVNYYRIKQVNTDASYSYSEIRSVNNISANGLSLFPNPGKGVFTLSGLEKGISHHLRVLDHTGKLILSANTKDEAYRFEMNEVSPGVYFIQVDGKEYLRFVKTE
jgi:hypothetical protein